MNEREQRAWRAVQFMHTRLTARLARELAATSDLSYQDYAVLVALTDQPDGRVRMFQLAHDLGWERSRLSHQVTRMVQRGLVSKDKGCPDRRGAFVVLSEQGQKAIETAAPGHVEAVRRLFIDVLTPRQLDAIGAAAQKVLDILDADPTDDEAAPAV